MKISVSEAYRTMLKEYPEILSVKQTAEILACDYKQVYKMINYGYFPAAKPGRSYCISKYGLIRYLLNEENELKGEDDYDG